MSDVLMVSNLRSTAQTGVSIMSPLAFWPSSVQLDLKAWKTAGKVRLSDDAGGP
jgi:hypothetical protein